MNNAWTTIACRACHAAAPAQRKPALQLFNSIRRYQSAFARNERAILSSNRSVERGNVPSSPTARQAFSTSRFLGAKGRNAATKPPKQPKPPAARAFDESKVTTESKLEPAKTSASHTEGCIDEDDPNLEELTWRDFDPEGGMPIPGGDRSQAEINNIFDSEEVDAGSGIYILNVMYWRRMSGALIDMGLDFPPEWGVTRDLALKALEYVRSLDPAFDEEAAGEVWVTEETERLKEQLRQRSVDLKLYKPDGQEAIEEEEPPQEESDQGTEYGRERTGESVLASRQRERGAHWKKHDAEEAARKEREQRAALYSARGPLELGGAVQPSTALTTGGPNDVAISGGQKKAWLQPVERKPWVKYYEDQATIIKDNAVPNLNNLQRLGPALLVTLLTLTACVYASDNYTPPPTSARLWPDDPPAVATLAGLTASIVAVFILGRVPFLWRANSKYFCIVPAYPYALSILGSAFRHDTFVHLASNLITLWLFGLALHEEVGRGTFLAIFFGSAVVGGYSSLVYNVFRKQWMSYVFGSSGAALGVVGASCLLRPNGSIKIFGYELPFAAWTLAAFWGLSELIAAARMRKTTIDHSGHVGGILAGAIAAAYLKRQAQADPNVMRETSAKGIACQS